MYFQNAVECSEAEYCYYREERCEGADILSDQLYVAMFCSRAMQYVVKCGVKVHEVQPHESSQEKCVVRAEFAGLEATLPVIMQSNGITEGWLYRGGRLWITNNCAVEEGFFRRPGQDADLCLTFTDEKVSRSESLEKDSVIGAYI